MQVAFGNTVSVLPAAQPVAPPEKSEKTATVKVDLQSSLAPIQQLVSARSAGSVSSFQPLVYNRPASNAGAPPSGLREARSNPDGAAESVAAAPELPSVAVRERGRDESGSDTSSFGQQPTAQDSVSGADSGNEGAREGSESKGEEPFIPVSSSGLQGLDEAQLEQIANLARRDREVRQHEQAHVSIGGQYASAPRYSFERGPDGRSYAVGGEVAIDVSPVPGNPEATIRKMETVRRAALAVADPSPQDRSVAATAAQLALQARVELNARRAEASRAPAAGGETPLAEKSREAVKKSDETEKKPDEPEKKSSKAVGSREKEAIRTYLDLISLGMQYTQNPQAIRRLLEIA